MRQVKSVTQLKRLQSQIGGRGVAAASCSNSLEFVPRHLVIPPSLGIRASSFLRRMFVSRHDIGTQKKIVDVSHSE
jgi:hypothetical protein